MILNTGCRTDIPAYYSEWFYNRIEAGFVLVRNPYHPEQFERMAAALQGAAAFCVISFIDLYEKTRRNFPQVRAVTKEEQEFLVKQFAEIGRRYRMPIRTCCENPELGKYGVETSGCMTQEVLERSTGCLLLVPSKKKAPRAECNCLLGADIGAYNTCPHGCIYCYANYDRSCGSACLPGSRVPCSIWRIS